MQLTNGEARAIIRWRVNAFYPQWKRFCQLLKGSRLFMVLCGLLFVAASSVIINSYCLVLPTDDIWQFTTPDGHVITSHYSKLIDFDGERLSGAVNVGIDNDAWAVCGVVTVVIVIAGFLVIGVRRVYRNKIIHFKTECAVPPIVTLEKVTFDFWCQTGELPPLPTNPKALRRYDKSLHA